MPVDISPQNSHNITVDSELTEENLDSNAVSVISPMRYSTINSSGGESSIIVPNLNLMAPAQSMSSSVITYGSHESHDLLSYGNNHNVTNNNNPASSELSVSSCGVNMYSGVAQQSTAAIQNSGTDHSLIELTPFEPLTTRYVPLKLRKTLDFVIQVTNLSEFIENLRSSELPSSALF